MNDVNSRLNQEFMDRVIHDLKAGIRQIRVSADLAEERLEQADGAGVRGMLDRIRQNAASLDSVLSSVMCYTVAGGVENYTFTRMNLGAAAQMAVQALDEAIAGAGADVSCEALPELMGDMDRLAEVFRHLIGNALAYRGEQAPRVTIVAARQENDWWISVRDNGEGIEPAYADRVFAPFYRLHGPEIPGVGLGLAICAKVLEAHKGKIWIRRDTRPGAEVVFSLPSLESAPEEKRGTVPAGRPAR
jgi:light-regulated signal transduction histidine kinase (bacteriophytochrome)